MTRTRASAIGIVAIVLATAFLVSCGNDEDAAEGSETDGAFIAGMVPHHESAIDMAEIAQSRAEHSEIKELADAIFETQASEIDRLESDHERLFDEPLGAMAAEHGDLGLSKHDAGMSMDATELEDLERARPFDLAFIDAMIPHHQGAIRMARIELAEGEDEELRALADEIIETQAREIEEMNDWRKEWYGSPSPAGGVPAKDGVEAAMDEAGSAVHEDAGH
jgi:uncharacterized protein (DUF305 family)